MDGRMLPLNRPLVNGQVVEIVQARVGMDEPGPSRDWLNPELGFVRSSRARAKVRQWFNAQTRGEEQAAGRERVEKALAREGYGTLSLDELAARLKYPSTQALFAGVPARRWGRERWRRPFATSRWCRLPLRRLHRRRPRHAARRAVRDPTRCW